MSAQLIQAIRGMNDIMPETSPVWQFLEGGIRNILQSYGYREIRFPIVEKTELFKRSIGEVTDIVEKEMYTFEDRNGDSLTLRPEGTASCVRAALQSGLINQGIQRLWYGGPMFRHERPQKGRYRQFHQIGAEAYGLNGPDIDAEMILMTARFWKTLGIDDVRLHINSLGNSESRGRYRQALVEYLRKHFDELDEDSRRRLETNPLRVLDSKNPQVKEVVKDAPRLGEYLDDQSTAHFAGLRERLDAVGISYVVNETLVRGLDYYSDTVFEWITDQLGAQGTICAGGRYDGLIEQLGGKPVPAVGFAMGLERLVGMLEGKLAQDDAKSVYFVGVGDTVQTPMLQLAENLRDQLPAINLQIHCGGGSFKSQFKKADRSGAELALVMGEDEWTQGKVVIKYLRDASREQETCEHEMLAQKLVKELGL